MIPTLNDAFDHDSDKPMLPSFRAVVSSHVEQFRTQRDHVHKLLGGHHAYSSGVFREDLFRKFLSSVLPKAVSVDSGFIYGFEQVPTSKQIDILIWDSSRHAAVFQAGEFVIVPPESVIAAISVKTSLAKSELEDALKNLDSVVPLDLAFRSAVNEKGESIHRPILKAIVAYKGPVNTSTALNTTSLHYKNRFAQEARLTSRLIKIFKEFNPVDPCPQHTHEFHRIFPKLVVAVDENPLSMSSGFGPPEDSLGNQIFGPAHLRRLPYMYPQGIHLTSPLEKLVYQVLSEAYASIGTLGWSLVSAWGEMHPIWGFRAGDAGETLEAQGVALLDPNHLAS